MMLDLTQLTEQAPALALGLTALMLVGSHLLNAATVLDRRRAHARNRRATAARLSAGRAFVATYNAAHADRTMTITGRIVDAEAHPDHDYGYYRGADGVCRYCFATHEEN